MHNFKVGDRVITNARFNHGAGKIGTVRKVNSWGDMLFVEWDNPQEKTSGGQWYNYKFDKHIETFDYELDAIPIMVAR